MDPVAYKLLLIVVSLVSATALSGQGISGHDPDHNIMRDELKNIYSALPNDIKIGPNMEVESEARCQKLARDPMFEPDMVVGKPWRIYYTWNMKLETKCVDITFKPATPAIIRRIYYDMTEYLIEQPTWGAATLLMLMGRAHRELLIFDDQGPAGRFLAVSNMLRDGTMSPTRGSVPLLKFQAKLIDGGRYLLLMDCYIGVASLSSRFDHPPHRVELDNIIGTVKHIFGEGHYGCTDELERVENMLND